MENQENLPDISKPEQKKSKKRPLRTKKRWMEMGQRILNGLANLTPEEAIQTLQYLDQRFNPHITEAERVDADTVYALRSERLRRMGVNPDEWTLFSYTQPAALTANNMDAQFTEEDMKRWSKQLPEGMELFVIQGEISPTSGPDRRNGREPFVTIPHFWEIYTKIKPEGQISEPVSPQIGTPQEPSI